MSLIPDPEAYRRDAQSILARMLRTRRQRAYREEIETPTVHYLVQVLMVSRVLFGRAIAAWR